MKRPNWQRVTFIAICILWILHSTCVWKTRIAVIFSSLKRLVLLPRARSEINNTGIVHLLGAQYVLIKRLYFTANSCSINLIIYFLYIQTLFSLAEFNTVFPLKDSLYVSLFNPKRKYKLRHTKECMYSDFQKCLVYVNIFFLRKILIC